LIDTGSLNIGVRRRLNSFFAAGFLAAGGPRVCDELDALDQLIEEVKFRSSTIFSPNSALSFSRSTGFPPSEHEKQTQGMPYQGQSTQRDKGPCCFQVLPGFR
jgi:hypothetical protein